MKRLTRCVTGIKWLVSYPDLLCFTIYRHTPIGLDCIWLVLTLKMTAGADQRE